MLRTTLRHLLCFVLVVRQEQALGYIQQLETSTTVLARMSPSTLNDNSAEPETITILGLGSLLSERSSRMTFPNLQHFRLGRVPNYRRVFGHPASIFFQRGIANKETLEFSSLSAEYVEEGYPGFVCTIYEVPNVDMMESGLPSQAYLEREEEFDIIAVPYVDLTTNETRQGGILCARSTDTAYVERWGLERFEQHYRKFGVDTIWDWSYSSGLRPCAPYLRHCALAAQKLGSVCYDSFLDETYLVDRSTTVRSYIEANPQVMSTEPPPELAVRYGG